jgi:hypothetical protein
MVSRNIGKVIETRTGERKMESLGKHFRVVAGTALARYGFAYAELLSSWAAIVGEDIASLCEPERIRWPRGGERQGGTLLLRAAPGRALDLQHEIPRIAERINGFYGYAAIGRIKLVEAPLEPARALVPRPRLDEAGAAALEGRLRDIADPALKEALRRLGEGALAAVRPPTE